MKLAQKINTALGAILRNIIEYSGQSIKKLHTHYENIFDEDKEGVDKKLSLVLFYILICAVAVIVGLFAINIPLSIFWEKSGQFGDFFGGVLNPILTFFTLFGLIATIVIQRRELRLSRQEYEKTAEALNTQAIETIFFNLLDLHHKIADEIKFDLKVEKDKKFKSIYTEHLPPEFPKETEIKSYRGRPSFEAIITYLTENCRSPASIVDRYKNFQNDNNHILGHYFRNLYQALKVIDSYEENFLTVKQKEKYTSILRAQLSSNELALLFLNCLDGICDRGQFRNLLIKYSMLEHLPVTQDGSYFYISRKILADNDMILQYKIFAKISIELKKYFGGAFGNNQGIPYDLSN